MNHTEFWYLLGLAAVALILLRLRPTLKANLRDPVVLSFTLGLFLGAFGNLSKQAIAADFIDAALGPNAAWLIADSLFLLGLCAGTYWVDLMSQPALRRQGRRLLIRRRTATVFLVTGWMIIAAVLTTDTWGTLERGGIDVGGRPLLLTARLAYAGYMLWSLSYLSYHFYRQRRHMRDRFNYIRLTIPWAAITLAIAAPILQIIGALLIFVAPNRLSGFWPAWWILLSFIQAAVAILIVATFFTPAYHFVSWLDKQILVRQLLRTRQAVARSRPDLALGSEPLKQIKQVKQIGFIVPDPDRWLATLVNELEMVKWLMGEMTYEIEAPAGGVMPDAARYALHDEQAQFLRGVTTKERLAAPRVTGDTYALARWYAAVGNAL